MKQTIKRVFVLTLAMVLVLSQYRLSKADLIASNYKKFRYVIVPAASGKKKKIVEIWDYQGKKKKIIIPTKIKGKTVRSVGLFVDSSQIKSMYIPKTVNFVSVSQATSLKKVVVSKKNKWLSVRNKLVCNKKGTVVKSCPGGLKNVVIPQKVNKIRAYSFRGSKVKSVIINNNVKTIWEGRRHVSI